MSWHQVQLTDTQIKQNLDGRIQSKFQTLFAKARAPRDMAMFCATHPGQRYGLYFSPATVEHAPEFLKLVGAEACEPPTEEVGLAVGDEETLQKLRRGQL